MPPLIRCWRYRPYQKPPLLSCPQVVLSSRSEGESRLQDLKDQGRSLSENQELREGRRQEVLDAVRNTQDGWWNVFQTAEEVLNQAESQAASERDLDDFKNQNQVFKSRIKEQKQKLLDLGAQVQFEDRFRTIQVGPTGLLPENTNSAFSFLLEQRWTSKCPACPRVQGVLRSAPDGEAQLVHLKVQARRLCENLREDGKQDVEQLVSCTEQLWTTVLQAARRAELQSLSEDFDSQSKNTETWIRAGRQRLQPARGPAPPEERRRTAQVCSNRTPLRPTVSSDLRIDGSVPRPLR